jgi:hypothetical protein
MANWDGYAAIKAEADRLGWPESYRTDLTKHDRGILARKDAPQRFGWSIRATGTDFYHPNCIWAVRWARVMYQSHDKTQRYYWYDGMALSSVSLDELIERLCQTLDVTFYEQRFQAASKRASECWRQHFSTSQEREDYVLAERERDQTERDYQEVCRLRQGEETV